MVVGLDGQSVSLPQQYVFFIMLVKNEPLTKQMEFWFSVIPSVYRNILACGIQSEQRGESQMKGRQHMEVSNVPGNLQDLRGFRLWRDILVDKTSLNTNCG